MAVNNENNLGAQDQSQILVEQIQRSIKEITRLYKTLNIGEADREAFAKSFNDRLKAAKGNLGSLNSLNDELLDRISGVSNQANEYSSNIGYVGKELNNAVQSLSAVSDYGRIILKDFKSLRDISTNIRDDKELTRVMSLEDLKSSREQVGVNQRSLETQVKRAAEAINYKEVTDQIRAEVDLTTQGIFNQGTAIKAATGRLGGQITYLNKILEQKKGINDEFLKTNVSAEKSIKINEQRNELASFLSDYSSEINDKQSEHYQLVSNIINKLQGGEQIRKEEFKLINNIVKEKKQTYQEEAAAAVSEAKFEKDSLVRKRSELNLARSIIEELKTTGTISAKDGKSIKDKTLVLTQNLNLLKGLSERDKLRVIKAIEANEVLRDNKTLYNILTDEIDKSVNREKELNKTIGFTGIAIKELSKVPVLGSIFRKEDVQAVTDEVRRLNKEYEDKAKLEVDTKRNSIVDQFITLQEHSNLLTSKRSDELAEIAKKLANNEKLSAGELTTVKDISKEVLDQTDIETIRKDVLQQISQLSEKDQKTLKDITDKVKNKKTLTETELEILEQKTGINTEHLNINETILDNIKKQGIDLEINAQKVSKMGAAGMMFNKVIGNLKTALTDPAAIFTALTAALLRNSTLINDFQKSLGVSYTSAKAMRNEFEAMAGASNDLFITSKKLQESFFKLQKATGVFFDNSSQSVETFTNLTERMGMSTEEAGSLTMLMRLQGKETETTLSNLIKTTSATLQVSKAGVSVREILSDMVSVSKGLQASFASNPQALAKAAVAARELGTTLKEIESIQKSLLKFESSIENELKAELLTGKQLNLEKARTAALNNDLEGVSRELGKQGVDLASFGKMNYLQQEAIAEAMGLSRDNMADMLLKQQTLGMSAEEVRAKFGDQAYEQFKALSAQDKFNAAVEKVKDLFGSIVTVLTPLIDGLAYIFDLLGPIANILEKINSATGGLSNALLSAVIVAKVLGTTLGGMVRGTLAGLGKAITVVFSRSTYAPFFTGLKAGLVSFKNGIILAGQKLSLLFKKSTYTAFFAGLKGGFTNLGGTIKAFGAKLTAMFSGSKAAAAASGAASAGAGAASAGAAAAGAAGKTPKPTNTGMVLRKKLHNIAQGIKSFAHPKVFVGGLNLILSTPGLITFSAAALPLKLVEKINGPKLVVAMKGISTGLKSFSGVKVTQGAGNLVLASAGLVTMIPGVLGAKMLEIINGPKLITSMRGLATGLKAFSGAKVIQGIGNLILASAGFIAMIPGVLGAKLLEIINGPKLSLTLTSIATGLIAMGVGSVAIGSANLIAAGVGFAASTIGAPGMLLISSLGTSTGTGLSGLAVGLTAMAPTYAGVGALVAAGAAFTLMTAGALGLGAVALLGEAAGVGLIGLAVGLEALGAAAATGLPFIGIAAIGALTLALVPLGATIALVGAGIMMAGKGIMGIIKSIGDVILAIIPALTQSLIDLANSVSFSQLAGMAGGLLLLGSSMALLGTMSPAIILGSIALGALSLAIIPLAAAGEGISVLADGFIRVAEAIQTLDISKIALLGVSVAALTSSLAGLIALGPIGLTALAVLGGIAAVGAATAGTSTSPSPTQGTETTSSNIENISIASATLTAETLSLKALNNLTQTNTADLKSNLESSIVEKTQDLNNTSIFEKIGNISSNLLEKITNTESLTTEISPAITSITNPTTTNIGIEPSLNQNTNENNNENMKTMIEETVTSTIKALVPEMVTALKVGQGNIKVHRDPFADSSQSELPDINRRISNNLFTS